MPKKYNGKRLKIVKYQHEGKDGIAKCLYIESKNYRLLFAISEVNWYTKGKKRLIPIWIDETALFCYRLAINLSKKKDKNKQEIELMNMS